MPEVIVRDLDDVVIETLKRRAAAKGVSLEQQLREVLTLAARPTKEEMLAQMRRIRAHTRPGHFPLAEDLIREDRDSR